VYELLVGPIPAGLVIDHLCRVPSCMNPAHLEPVTNAENIRRGYAARGLLTHCSKGHELTPESTYARDRGYRRCKQCAAVTLARFRARRHG
jgi:hypothetical protein